jgi:predicted phosphodiesterase
MANVRIVHLSDLHFSLKNKDPDVWTKVADFINSLKPDAILVTGDVTDNASEAEFQLAANSLNQLKIKNPKRGRPNFWIIPGNHDRYTVLGNQLRIPNWIPATWRRRYKERVFDSFFKDQHLSPGRAELLNLGPPDSRWNVRLLGLDSNCAQWFAQGAVTEPSAAQTGAIALAEDPNDDCDLVIALVHHHLFPIPEVERRAARVDGRGRVGSLSNVANFTGMLNSGILLEHLTASQVNIVLHGHEHARHQALFRGASPYAGSTVVLAAGSATGEETRVGWALDRIHFNVLELEESRTVHLSHAIYDAERELDIVLLRGSQLLSADDIRRARFVRRFRRQGTDTPRTHRDLAKSVVGPPSSRLKKLVVVGTDRGADITETCTDFLVGKDYSLTTQNASGFVDSAYISFEWNDGTTTLYETPFSATIEGNEEVFRCGVPLEDRGDKLAVRTTANWRWNGGIVLTRSELNALAPSARPGLRNKGCEFVGINIVPSDEFEAASLTLQLPDEFTPDSSAFQVYFERCDQPGSLELSNELTKTLEFCGRGHVELRISYPKPGYRYYLAWPVVDPSEKDLFDPLVSIIATKADALFSRAKAAISTGEDDSDIRIALYCQGDEPRSLVRVAGNSGSLSRIYLDESRSRSRTAMWGKLLILESGNGVSTADMLPDEDNLGLFPIRLPWNDGKRASGLLRVAAIRGGRLDSSKRAPETAQLVELFTKAALAADEVAREASVLMGRR